MALIPFMHTDTLFIRCCFLWRTILWASRSPKDQMWHQWEICMSNVCVQGPWTSPWQNMENTKTHPLMLHAVKRTGQTHPLLSSQEEGQRGRGAADTAKVSLTLQEGLSYHYFCSLIIHITFYQRSQWSSHPPALQMDVFLGPTYQTNVSA